ncbi:MAG: biopolymer transporter ExbD, partial [Burkholderiaceae bacterium]
MKLYSQHLSPHLGGTEHEPSPMIEMNTTPLIDVMLVLIVMLIITIPVQLHSVNL